MLTPSRCGRMDQCVVMGPGAVGLMEFTGSSCSLRKLSLGNCSDCSGSSGSSSATAGADTGAGAAAGACTDGRSSARNGDEESVEGKNGTAVSKKGLYFVIVDLKAGKDTVVILRDLNKCFPHPQDYTQVLCSVPLYHGLQLLLTLLWF